VISSERRRPLLALAAIGGAAGLAWYIAKLDVRHAKVIAGIAALLVVGLLDLVGRIVGRARGGAILRGLDVAWPAGLVLAALPLAHRWPHALAGHVGALVGGLALAVLTWRVDRVSPTRVPLVATRIRGRRLGAWELSLLAIPIASAVLYIHIGAHAQGHLQNDSAYYFGVARHMAITHRFEEPIVWHFVAAPPAIVHPPFDYWGGLTSLVLAPVLAIFGPTQHTAFIAMAVISALSVLAFWYLLCVALPVRYPAIQLLALVAFVLSHNARNYRFDTESLPLYHLLIILALIALFTERLRMAIVMAFLLAMCRVDGSVLFITAVVYVVVKLRRSRADLRRALMLTGGLVGAYVLRNLWSFRTLTPPGSSAAAIMANASALYRFHGMPDAPDSVWKAAVRMLQFNYIATRFSMLIERVTQLRMLPAQELWYMLALGSSLVRSRRSATALIPVLALTVTYVFLWGSGEMVQQWRTVSGLMPLLVLGATFGVAAALDGVVAATRRTKRLRRTTATAITAVFFIVLYPIVTRVEVYGPREPAAMLAKEQELRALDRTFGGRPVATPEPWYVMARTRSPAVSLPADGSEAVMEVLRRYQVEWIVVLDEKSTWRGVFGAIASGKENPGYKGLQLERVPAQGTAAVFRVLGR
jgi:hypothetical protein